MKYQESEPFEWYIFDGLCDETSTLFEHAVVRLGPFLSESECRSILRSICDIPPFDGHALVFHKRRR